MTIIQVKSANQKISLNSLPPEAWTIISGGESAPAATLAGIVPFMFRGVHLRAAAVASFPWAIYGSGSEPLWKADDDEQPEALEWLGDLPKLMYLIEASTTSTGRAYAHVMANRVRVTALRYLMPSSVEPVFSKTTGELQGFMRRMGSGARVPLQPAELLHFWRPDYQVETGPPRDYPLKAAMAAAGVLGNMDKFLAAYFERGMVRATLLTASGVVQDNDRERLKSWWQRTATGIKNAFATEVIQADAVTPVIIGEGVSELGNGALTEEKRHDILTALGIPASIMMANAANYATAEQDAENWVQYTVMPECRWIQRTLNEQLFQPRGLRLEFEPRRHETMQRAELTKAEAVQRAVGRPVLTVNEGRSILGYEPVPDGDMLSGGFEAAPMQQAPPPMADAEMPPADTDVAKSLFDPVQQAEDERRFRAWYGKRLGADVDRFESAHLTRAAKVVMADDLLRRAVEMYP